MISSTGNWQSNGLSQDKILLILMPFWDPQIPPLGISGLKSCIQQYKYKVKSIDANVNEDFREICNKYFELIKKYIPGNKRRHLLNIGHDILRNHSMAYLNRQNQDEATYMELVKKVLVTTFYCEFDMQLPVELDKVMAEYYEKLEIYFLDLLRIEKPAVLGVSVYSGTLPASLFVFKLAKKKYPSIQTVMGGGIFAGELSIETPNFNFFVENTPYIDKIIVGEGERLFLKLLRGELPHSQKVFTLQDIDKKNVDLSSAPPLIFPILTSNITRKWLVIPLEVVHSNVHSVSKPSIGENIEKRTKNRFFKNCRHYTKHTDISYFSCAIVY